MVKPRSRLLSFRMTGEEYDKLRTASDAQGARCLSDFARTALLQAVETGPAGLGPCLELAKLEKRIEALTRSLELLLRNPRPGPATDSASSRPRNDETNLP
jgi:hypothetical protein